VPPPAGVEFEPGSPAYADVLARAKAAGKAVFVDFSTESCGWCKRLDADVFSQPETAAAMKPLVCVHVDAEKGEGVELARRYRVRGYPTLLFVDAAGEEIDRIVGYEPLEEFNEHVQRILRGEDTIADVRKRRAAAPDDPELNLEYAGKLAPSDPDGAEKLFAAVIASKTSDRSTVFKARLGRTEILADTKRHDEALREGRVLLAEMPAGLPVQTVLSAVYKSVHGGADPSSALSFLDAAAPKAAGADANAAFARISVSYSRMDVHQRAIVETLRSRVEAESAVEALQPGNPNGWTGTNFAAWTCFLMKRNLTQAIEWARTAVARSHDEPTTLDTLANLLWLTCENEEAVRLETRAAATAQGAEKREYAGTLAKWKVDLEMRKSEPQAVETEELEDDNYPEVIGPCGK
jgi:thiol-disulfide isomerase/thioredoxin